MAINEGELPRKVMTLFMVVDSSGSMEQDGNIGKVNRAIEETAMLLRDVSDENFDAEIKIAVLEFSSGVNWVTNGAESLSTFNWNDLVAGGLTQMGEAFTELETKLSRNEFLKSTTGAYAPVIILLSDGMPTDDYKAGLEKLKHNNWFKAATKIAIAVNDASTDILAEFSGGVETVIRCDGHQADLKKLLTRLAVVSSTIQSRSTNVSVGLDRTEDNRENTGDDIWTNGLDFDAVEQESKKIAEDVVSQVENESHIWSQGW